MKQYICIDIGGTAIKYGLIDEEANLLLRESMDTQAWKGGPGILEKTVNIVSDLLNRVQEPISGICISTAGMVDIKEGSIFYSAPLIPNFTGTQFKRTLEEKFHLPCEVENDVNCAGLAECRSGAALGSKVALMLTIGTGIGGCILLDGNVFHGFSNSACEIGYMHMDNSDFQTLGAASILTKKVAFRKGDQEENWNGYRIFEEAKKGDEICIQAIDEMADILGKGISNICYVLNPQVVVLGGGIMAQEDYLKEKICTAVKKYLVSGIEEHTTLTFARHKNDAGMLGAFYHFCEMQKQD